MHTIFFLILIRVLLLIAFMMSLTLAVRFNSKATTVYMTWATLLGSEDREVVKVTRALGKSYSKWSAIMLVISLVCFVLNWYIVP